jgi:hypothetical protein
MKKLILFPLALSLSGCGMLLTINPIGMLGIVHHRSHHTPLPPCQPYPRCHIDDSGMGPKSK